MAVSAAVFMLLQLLFAVSCISHVITETTPDKSDTGLRKSCNGKDFCKPLVIAHRGASGYVPEHTLGSYALAITLGADYVEPDLVITKDLHLVARHDNELSLTTDVAHRSKFASRKRTQSVDGEEVTGWFVEDFTLAEIKSLRVVERIPEIRPGNARLDGSYTIPTFEEILNLVKAMQMVDNRTIGIYPEIKHSTHFSSIGKPMEKLLVDTFENNGYVGPNAPVYIQSFEVSNLRKLKGFTDLKLLQLYDDKSDQPFDQVQLGTDLTYGDMATPEGLMEVASYASAVGPDKKYIIPRDEDNRLLKPTSFVDDAHKAGLQVHPYTFRAENYFLPAEFRSTDTSDSEFGDFEAELKAYIATGIDGLFSDQPDIAVRVRGAC